MQKPDEHEMKQLKDDTVAYGISVRLFGGNQNRSSVFHCETGPASARNSGEHRMKQLRDDTLAYSISVQFASLEATSNRHSPTTVSNLSNHQLQIESRNVESR